MTIHINYQKGKVLQALRYHFISLNQIKILLIVVNVFALVAAGFLAFKLIRPFPFLMSSFLWFILMITFWFILPLMVYRKSVTFREKITLTFREKDLLLETGPGYTNWSYGKFRYYLETPHFFHLYMTESSFFLIPKADCIEPAGTVEVREWLDNKIGRK